MFECLNRQWYVPGQYCSRNSKEHSMAKSRIYYRLALSALLAAVFCTNVAAQTASSGSFDSATLTTLPAAEPTSNNTDPCAFTDRNSLIDRVESDWTEYNVSLLVATCDSVCLFVYGAGNPDISGIGVCNPCHQWRVSVANTRQGHDIIRDTRSSNYRPGAGPRLSAAHLRR